MKRILFVLSFCSMFTYAVAQHSVKPKPAAGNGLLFRFGEEENRFLKMNIWLQTWLQYIENNPGTAVNNNPEKWSFSPGFRRMRIQMMGQVSPRFFLMLQMGANNQSVAAGGGTGTGASGVGKRAPFYFHDAYGQFNIVHEKDPVTKRENKFSLAIGTGLHSWNGVSRLTNASSISLLTADFPIFNFPTVEFSDQLVRMFGVFAKGVWGKINYRISTNKPFITSRRPVVGGPAVDNNQGNQLSYNGYLAYQFWEKDAITTAFYAGSFYGKKKMLTLGAGIYHSPKSTMTQPDSGKFVSHHITTFGLDLFYDAPIGNRAKDMVFTCYGVWYNYDFGPRYMRTVGVMNPGRADTTFTGTKALEGYGNARISMGTGNICYAQTAFLLPEFSEKVRIQPYLSYAWKDLKALNQPGHFYNIGTNCLFLGNNAKISLEYANRPLYNVSERKIFRRACEVLAVLQFWL